MWKAMLAGFLLFHLTISWLQDQGILPISVPKKKAFHAEKVIWKQKFFFFNFLMTNSLTCFSACSLWASMSRMFFSARALAWKLIMMRITRDYRTQNTEHRTSRGDNSALEYTARSAVRWCLSNFALCLRADSTSTTVNKSKDTTHEP